jgi:hypothetical protein
MDHMGGVGRVPGWGRVSGEQQFETRRHWRPRNGSRHSRPSLRHSRPSLEVELENCSDSPLEIEYTMTPLQFLELEVIGPSGAIVSEGHFSDRFSPMRDSAVLRLLPGEKFTAEVSLLATVPRGQRPPGRYTVRASFCFQESKVMAEPLTVELTRCV